MCGGGGERKGEMYTIVISYTIEINFRLLHSLRQTDTLNRETNKLNCETSKLNRETNTLDRETNTLNREIKDIKPNESNVHNTQFVQSTFEIV